MINDGNIKMYALTLDCPDPYQLAKFYAEMLNWDIAFYDEAFACIGAKGMEQGAYPGITFQKNSAYTKPVWPEEKNKQQQMAHLDFAVLNLEEAVQWAVQCGATIASQQFSTGWKVMFDPAGHPFCLCEMKSIFNSPHFGLR